MSPTKLYITTASVNNITVCNSSFPLSWIINFIEVQVILAKTIYQNSFCIRKLPIGCKPVKLINFMLTECVSYLQWIFPSSKFLPSLRLSWHEFHRLVQWKHLLSLAPITENFTVTLSGLYFKSKHIFNVLTVRSWRTDLSCSQT